VSGIDGGVDEGYGKVADAFRRNFSDGKEIGGAVAVYRDGRKVVDLWGGYRNERTQSPWQRDSIVNVFSTTKGVASLAVAVAASRGLLDYDAKVVDYWPEFGQAGKDAITVRQLLSHQAGLAAIDPPLTLADIADPSSWGQGSPGKCRRGHREPETVTTPQRSAGISPSSFAGWTRSAARSDGSSPKRLRRRSDWTSTSDFPRPSIVIGSPAWSRSQRPP
jgi:CubicO group peptidase (beta-lactamase class C family)